MLILAAKEVGKMHFFLNKPSNGLSAIQDLLESRQGEWILAGHCIFLSQVIDISQMGKANFTAMLFYLTR